MDTLVQNVHVLTARDGNIVSMFVDVCTRSNTTVLAPQKMLLIFVGAVYSTKQDAAIALTKPAGNTRGSLTRQLSTRPIMMYSMCIL